ncbi:MAG TPA: EAL domain-containing protein [Thermoanaerobaculia bacterium]
MTQRVLFLQDVCAARTLLEGPLRERGYEVLAASCPEEARLLLGPRPSPCLILSGGRPGEEAEVCRQARSIPPAGRNVVVVLTSDASPARLRELVAAGADDWLVPPVDPELLDLRLTALWRRLAEAVGGAEAAGETSRVEEDLRLTQLLIDGAPDAAFWTDSEGRFLWVNESACASLGRTREELLSLRVPDILRPEDAGLVPELMRTLRQTRKPVTFETVHVTRSGRTFPVEVTVNRLEYNGRESYCAFARDVTERKQVEQALRESEERYHSLFDGVPVGLYRTTPDGRMLDANMALVEILGFPSREALMQVNVGEVYLDPEDRHRWQREVEAEGEVRTLEAQVRHFTGRAIWVRFSLQAFRDEDGRVIRYEGALEDVTGRRLAEAALRSSEERFRALVQNASDLIGILEEDGTVRYESPSHQRVLGHPPEDCLGKSFLDLIHPQDRPLVANALRCLVEQPGDIVTLEYRRRHRDGGWRFLESTASNLLGHPAVAGVVLNSHDITDRKEAEERLLHDALHDELTGLPNRALFMDRLKQSMERSRREPGRLTIVLFLDIDRFKIVNDSLGHLVGDELLVKIAGSLSAVLRPTDTIARMGGDEFAILLEGSRDVGAAEEVARRIHERMASAINLRGHEVFLSASIGIAVHTPEYERPEDLLRDADTAMYRAKSLGPAGHVVFNRGMHQFVMARLQLETDLRRALEREQLQVFYQPFIDLRTGEVTGLEALLRWVHPRHGLILPDEFLSVAEETGLIVPIGQFVLEEACRKVRELQRRHPGHPRLKLSVNLSNKQFFQADLFEQVRAALLSSGLDPACLGLEITEGVIIQHAESANTRFARLKSLGVQLYMDDFGKGYSSFNYLHRLPMDILKIDRSFVSRVEETEGNVAILEAIVTLAHQLGMEVVAEGIQTAGQVKKIRALGCEYGQGFLFSKPLSGDDVGSLLADPVEEEVQEEEPAATADWPAEAP